MNEKTVSLVISVFNEEKSLPYLFQELTSEIRKLEGLYRFELVFVNDGSKDNSLVQLQSLKDDTIQIRTLNFSRNFGHEAAMIAGIDHAKGDVIICMDADLQHPPTEIKKMLEAHVNGADVVLMIRKSRKDVGFLRKLNNKMFYSVINMISQSKIEANASDFFLISSRIASVLKNNYRNKTRFLRWIIQNIGFDLRKIEYEAPERIAGESKYSTFKLFRLAFNAVVNTTISPLKVGLFVGIIFSIFSFIIGIYSLIMYFYKTPVGGYTTIVVFLSFAFGILFILLGIIGEYLGKLFIENQDRPIYLIESIIENNKDSAITKDNNFKTNTL